MKEDRAILPEWVLNQVREEYAAELAEIADDRDAACFSFGWNGDDLSVCLLVDGKDVKYETVSLSEICDEPANSWSGRDGTASQEHYDLIKKIADGLKKQSDRLYDVHKNLKVRED